MFGTVLFDSWEDEDNIYLSNLIRFKLPYVRSATVILAPSFFISHAISTKEVPLHSEW